MNEDLVRNKQQQLELIRSSLDAAILRGAYLTVIKKSIALSHWGITRDDLSRYMRGRLTGPFSIVELDEDVAVYFS